MESSHSQASYSPPARRHVAAVLLGNGLEFYDFLTYSFFALQIGRTFFPSKSPVLSLLLSLATFGAGFATRPVGAFVIGRYADRRGRRPAMLLSFLLMGIAIFGIAFTPSYRAIGVAAPILVVLWRLLQGFALGGEVGPSTAFLIETAPPRQHGFFGSLQIATQGVAILVAGLVGVMLTSIFDAGTMDSWGWRCAFVLGGVVVPLGLVIRRALPETLHRPSPRFEQQLEPERRSIVAIVVLGLCLLIAGTIATYVRTYMTTYAVTTLGYSSHVAFVTTIINGGVMAISAAAGGLLGDRLGGRRVMFVAALLLAITTMPIFLAITHYHTPLTLYAGMFLLAAFGNIFNGPVMGMISDGVPNRLRAGVVGTVYAVAISVFGGTTPFIVAWLIDLTGNALVPGWYSVGATLVGLVALVVLREKTFVAASVGVSPAG